MPKASNSNLLGLGFEAKSQRSSQQLLAWRLNLGNKRRRIWACYLDQWQFPLTSDVARKKLCHQNHPFPNDILHEDLLKHWLGNGNSPLQFLFMGVKGSCTATMGSRNIDCTNCGWREVCTHTLRWWQEKSIVLGYKTGQYWLAVFPAHALAQVWKTALIPAGKILLMPGGTYHQCQNIMPCLSYLCFCLDMPSLTPCMMVMQRSINRKT